MSRAPAKPHDSIGAFVPHSPSPIAGADDGALVGLGFAVKDLFDISGHVTGASTACPSSNMRPKDAGENYLYN